jgi:4-amino-4-deoxy-L-arabinose transferase-like glycosyltransferase
MMPKAGIHKLTLLAAPLLFLLFSAPGALDYVFHYPDEKYYTDAVLQMMDKGDLFTPYQADGSPRFKKPIVTYWVLMASYNLFGVSRVSSRLFFWLAGALLVLVTFLMAKSLSKNRQIALTAAFITAANPLVLLSASRSIPDILLVLFLTVSAWGFLEILVSVEPRKIWYWMAYPGAALAFETKGIPAAAFAVVSVLFLLFNPWKPKKLKQIIGPWSLIVAVLVAASWFVIMYAEHGTSYFSSFFDDQVGGRVSSKITQVIKNTFLGIITLIGFLIPWILIVFPKSKKIKESEPKITLQNKAVFVFILMWVILTILMSGAVFKFYDRYVLPVIPLVAFLFAHLLAESPTGLKKTFLNIFLILNLFVVSINILYALFVLPDLILILGIVVGVAVIVVWSLGLFRSVSAEIQLANGIMFLFFNVFILLYPLLMPNPGQQLVNNLKSEGISENEKVYVYGNIRTASNIRIHSRNQFEVVSMDTLFTLPREQSHFLVFDEKEQTLLDLQEYKILQGSEEWSQVPVEKFPGFLQKNITALKESGTRYLIAKPQLSEK